MEDNHSIVQEVISGDTSGQFQQREEIDMTQAPDNDNRADEGREELGVKEQFIKDIMNEPEEKKVEEKQPDEANDKKEPEGSEEKGTEEPKKFVDDFDFLAEREDFKNLTVEEGKQRIKDILMSDELAEAESLIDFMEKNSTFRDKVLELYDSIENGEDVREEKDESRFDDLDEKESEELRRIEALEQAEEERREAEEVQHYNKVFDKIRSEHVDAEGNTTLDNEDLKSIIDIAVRNNRNDLHKVAELYVQRRDQFVKKAIEKAIEAKKPEIIKEYLNLKQEDRDKIIDTKGASTPPNTPAGNAPKENSWEASKKGFLNSMKELING